MTITPRRTDDSGMILVNVLVIVMLATAVLAIMLATEDNQVERSAHLRFASQAMATARGGEMSAIAELRRDLVRDMATGNQSDTLAEPWANIADTDARIVGGHFSFVVSDAQARFNINNLAHGDAISIGALNAVAVNAGIRPDHVAAVVALLHQHGPIRDLSELRAAGVSEGELQRLSIVCAALPTPTTVNVNTASEALLVIMTGNLATAHAIILARGKGGIGVGGTIGMQTGPSADHILLPPGTGVASEYFWARGRVTNGGTSQQLTTLLHRRLDQGQPVVVAIERWRGAAPLAAPQFGK
jgi:general secretion pathway protein K